MNKRTITIISRKSPLALWQAECVKYQIEKTHPDVICEIIGRSTEGDRMTTSLTEHGGKDLFVRELQKALLNGEADIAVHSIKDMSVHEHPDLTLAAILARDDARDVLVANGRTTLTALPQNAVIGTSSPRRQCQLKQLRPDCQIKSIRGNLGTRLAKLDAGEYDAIVLAAAGLKRLQLEHHISQYFNIEEFIPAIGQGAIGVECRRNSEIETIARPLDHRNTRLCVTAERAVNRQLGGNCFTPIAAHAVIKQDELSLSAILGNKDCSSMVHAHISGLCEAAEHLGFEVAHALLRLVEDHHV